MFYFFFSVDSFIFFFFFFQAEDGIRDLTVTGVQTCAPPISRSSSGRRTLDPGIHRATYSPTNCHARCSINSLSSRLLLPRNRLNSPHCLRTLPFATSGLSVGTHLLLDVEGRNRPP